MDSIKLANANHPIFGNKELFREVLKNLNVFEIVRTIGIVCKTWNLASKDFQLLKQIDMPFWMRAKLNPTPKKTIISIENESIYALYRDRVIVADKEGNLTLFAKTGERLSEKKAHESGITHLKIAEGKCLSVSQEAVKVWDLESQAPLSEPLFSSKTDKESQEIVQKVAFSGRHIVADVSYETGPYSSGLRMRVWDTQSLTRSQSLRGFFFKITFLGKHAFFINTHALKLCAIDLEKNSIVATFQELKSIESNFLYGIDQSQLCLLSQGNEKIKVQLYSLPELNLQERELPKQTLWGTHKHYISAAEINECTLLSFKENNEPKITEMIHLPQGYVIKVDGSNRLLLANGKLHVISSSSVDFESSKGLILLTSSDLEDLKRVKIKGGLLYFYEGLSLTILDYKEKALEPKT